MIISEELSHAYDESCITVSRGHYEGRVFVDPMGRVWAESDGEIWEVEEPLAREEMQEKAKQDLSWRLEAERQAWEEGEDRYGYDPGGW
jgi:hypothetical protein